jgi:DNA polymerase-3 subunit chi
MTDIQFYHLTSTPLERALPKLLEKALQGGFKTLVLMESEEKAEAMNNVLWTYDPASFLPHGTEKDGNTPFQPIFITTENNNLNQADLIVVTNGTILEDVPSIRRVLDIFDGNDESATTNARTRWKKYQSDGHKVTYYQQNEKGGWLAPA